MPDGYTVNPRYEDVCSGLTDHNEILLVIYDPNKISYDELLKIFRGSHDPTQGMRRGNDVCTQYRSEIYAFSNEQKHAAEIVREHYQDCLDVAGYSAITTEIIDAPEFYYAEDYHQQYLAKNPAGYCDFFEGAPFNDN